MEIHPVCNLRVANGAVELSGGAITTEAWMLAFIPPSRQADRFHADGTG